MLGTFTVVVDWGWQRRHTATIHRSSRLFPREQPKLAEVNHLLVLVTAALPENPGSLMKLTRVVVRRHIEGKWKGGPKFKSPGLKLELAIDEVQSR